ncbi:amidase family protein, partial [Brevundimonas sp.]|uniref:amidase family protein n=1 Tax=Brevundimonas sp. TaxID=1871086 RepID=UPI003918796D
LATAAPVPTALAGTAPSELATAEAEARRQDPRAAPDAGSLRGTRLGALRYGVTNYSADTQAAFEAALASLRAAGAELVEITTAPQTQGLGQAELTVLMYELKADLNAYLASTNPAQVTTRTLAEVIAFNEAEPRETVLFGQELLLQAEATSGLDNPDYIAARANSLRMAGPEGIDRMLAENNVVALIAPSTSRAWTNDREDQDNGQGSASRLPAVAGYPHLTVPMGLDRGMPVGISFIGAKWDDARILSLGYAYEQASPRPPRP